MKLKKRAKIKNFSFRNPRRISKRGQITYFIIVGILLIVITGFFVYMRVSTVKKRTEKEVVRVKEQAFSTEQVETYVTECLRRLLFKSLDYVGHQCGQIFNVQEFGLSTDIKHIKCEDANPIDCITADPDKAYQVPYALLELTNIYGTPTPPKFASISPPFYPWRVFPYKPTSVSPYPPDTSQSKIYGANPFGSRDMPKLHKESECLLEDKPNSINCQIESYMYRNIDGISQDDDFLGGQDYCLYSGDISDPNDIGEFIGTFKEQGYEIKGPYEKISPNQYKKTGLGDKSVNVTISDNDVNVYLIYPLEIKDIATGQTVVIKDFHANANIRLGKIYKFAKELIGTDKFDVKLDIDSKTGSVDYDVGYASVPYYDSNMEVSLIENVDVDAQDDFVQVKDDISLLEGNPYKFWFVRKNRRPALEYIATVKIDGEVKDITPAKSLPASQVIHLQEDSKIEIDNIRAIDPDEDDLTNNYEVYVYDYFEDIPTPKLVLGPIPIKNNKWEKEIDKTPEIKPIGPGVSGVYNITILVKDESGLEDFQTILAKVNTKPKINMISFQKPSGSSLTLKDTKGDPITKIECGKKAISKKQKIKFVAKDITDPDDYSSYKPDPIFSEGLIKDDKANLNYLWELVGSSITEEGRGIPKFTYDFTKKDTYTIKLTVTDNSSATHDCSFGIKVENEPPTASISPYSKTVSSGTKIWFTGKGKDDDGEIVGYKWVRKEKSSDCKTTPLSWSTPSKGKAPTIKETEDYTFSKKRYVCFHVKDDDGATAVAMATITIK